jgi:arginine N-succinyltransferase
MFYIRQAQLDDASSLLKLSRMVNSNNLPDDAEILRSKIIRSRKSFSQGERLDRTDREFIFVLEDTHTGNVIGGSSIIAAMGGPDRPNLFLKVRKREFYSEDLQTGQVHVTLQLCHDETGPSEIGGLILAPGYRGHGPGSMIGSSPR